MRKTGNITFQWWLLLASPVIDDVRLFLIDIRLWLRCCNERWLDSVSITSYLHIGRRPICRPASHFSCDVHQNAHEETVTVLSLSLSFCLTRQPNFKKNAWITNSYIRHRSNWLILNLIWAYRGNSQWNLMKSHWHCSTNNPKYS